MNFWGTLYVAKAFLPLLTARPEALLLNFASMGGLVPVPGQGAYGASKGAVKLFSETLFAELHSTSVHVTTVFPGGVSTNIAQNSGLTMPTNMSEKAMKKAMKHTTTPQRAGQLVIEAIEKDRPRLLIGSDAKALDRLSRVNPVGAITTVQKQMAKMMAGMA